jgi:GTPase
MVNDISKIAKGVLKSDRTLLARAITLVESNSPEHMDSAQELLKMLHQHSGNSIRIGITGSPGVGKSTFIEAFGTYLCDQGKKVAVLAIDPSSTLSHGSILGDKTRMEELSRNPNAFIRPSASGGTLGGVARKTRESILLCESAGYDVILVETVGVGQSETTVRSMVDFFMLLILPGGGDELQGIKKGSVELADALVINKADGNNETLAQITKRSYENALHMLMQATEGWQSRVFTTSAYENIGIDKVWESIRDFESATRNSGIFDKRRRKQILEWVYFMLEENILNSFYSSNDVKNAIPTIEKEVLDGSLTPANAVKILMKLENR